ncbi:MAG: hypothetical protein ACFFD4_08400 [Candidatus Odinarchaeota archaeon]
MKIWLRSTTCTAHSAFAYPSLWLGEKPFDNLRDYFRGIDLIFTGEEIVIQTSFREYPLWISRIGCFYLGCDDKQKALLLLNGLIALIQMFANKE